MDKLEPFFQCENVVLYNADFRKGRDLFAPGDAALVFTDPPYGNANQSGDLQSRLKHIVKGAGRTGIMEPIAGDKPEEWEPLMRDLLAFSAHAVDAEEGAVAIMCGGGGPNPMFARLALMIDDVMAFEHAVVWDKIARRPGLGWKFRRDFEFVMVGRPKRGKLAWNEEQPATSNIVNYRPVDQLLHPNEKPVELVAHFIRCFTRPNELVIDPFAGSGTTLEAARMMGRRAVGFEIDAKHCETAAKRLSQQVLL